MAWSHMELYGHTGGEGEGVQARISAFLIPYKNFVKT